MALPKQVQKDIEELENMERAMTAPAPEKDGHSGTTEDTTPEPTTAEVTPTEKVEPTEPQQPTENWEEKYNRLQGKFRTEVSQLHQQNKDLLTQMQVMQQQFAEMQKPKEPEQRPDRLVTEKDEEAFGSDLIDVQRRVAREVFTEYVTPLQQELKVRDAKIAELENRLTQTGGEIASMSFEDKLYKAVPNFSEINNSPEWAGWLDEIDPFTGEPRRAYAEYVYNNGMVDKVVNVVRQFLSGKQPQQPDPRQSRQTELQRQVQPTRSANATTPSQGERTYTQAEWDRLWSKVTDLSVRGKQDEAAALEHELSVAATQGRVR